MFGKGSPRRPRLRQPVSRSHQASCASCAVPSAGITGARRAWLAAPRVAAAGTAGGAGIGSRHLADDARALLTEHAQRLGDAVEMRNVFRVSRDPHVVLPFAGRSRRGARATAGTRPARAFAVARSTPARMACPPPVCATAHVIRSSDLIAAARSASSRVVGEADR